MTRRLLIAAALSVLGLLLVLPLASVFVEALSRGLPAAWDAITDPDAVSAIRTTILVAAISVTVNAVGGLAASWCIARFRFRGRALLLTLIEVPFSLSPIISGLVWVLLFGAQGWFGPALQRADIQIVFAFPGLVLATLLVTFPFVVRPLIPLMARQGVDEELAALTLGASGWQVFRLVTLPNIRWALLQGVLMCNARAMGEFGAVSVVSGHIRGQTDTLPLHIEVLYNDFNSAAAFAVASVLSLLGLLTLGAKLLLDRRGAFVPA